MSRVVARLSAAMLAMGLAADHSSAQDLPPQEPQLVIEPGMHTAKIRKIAVDRNCSILATSSFDRTVRIWKLPDSQGGQVQLQRTLRLPIDAADGGRIKALALSLDGKLLAVGGHEVYERQRKEFSIYVYDMSTGHLVRYISAPARRYDDYVDSPNDLAFSRDGRLLATVVSGYGGLFVWDTNTWELKAEDLDYVGAGNALVFDDKKRLFVAGQDGYLRRYGPVLERNAKPEASVQTLTLGSRF